MMAHVDNNTTTTTTSIHLQGAFVKGGARAKWMVVPLA